LPAPTAYYPLTELPQSSFDTLPCVNVSSLCAADELCPSEYPRVFTATFLR